MPRETTAARGSRVRPLLDREPTSDEPFILSPEQAAPIAAVVERILASAAARERAAQESA
jgi:hypothetical protein